MNGAFFRRAPAGTACRGAVPLALVLALALAQPAQAQSGDAPGKGDGLGSLLDETTSSVLRLFQTLMKAIPQFEAPEVLPNGDIIIRRKPPGSAPEEEEEEPEEGETRRI